MKNEYNDKIDIICALGWRKKQPIASVSDVDVLRKVL